MAMIRLTGLVFVRCLILASLAAGGVGCGLPPKVAWLPDSSGFVYCAYGQDKQQSLVQYDLASKARRVILTAADAPLAWPQLDPAGKQFALLHYLSQTDEAATVQISTYTLDGKEVRRSRQFAWPRPTDSIKEGKQSAVLYWAPNGRQIVLTDGFDTGIYDIASDQLKIIQWAVPLEFERTPFRPDGKGFLATLVQEKDEKIVSIDLSGKVESIALDEGDLGDGHLGLQMYCAILTTFWDGGKATMAFGPHSRVMMVIDTQRRTATTRPYADLQARFAKQKDLGSKDDLPIFEHIFPGGAILSDVFSADGKWQCIEFTAPGKKTVGILHMKADSATFMIPFPSPNRKYVAILVPKGLLVIDATGATIATLDDAVAPKDPSLPPR